MVLAGAGGIQASEDDVEDEPADDLPDLESDDDDDDWWRPKGDHMMKTVPHPEGGSRRRRRSAEQTLQTFVFAVLAKDEEVKGWNLTFLGKQKFALTLDTSGSLVISIGSVIMHIICIIRRNWIIPVPRRSLSHILFM